jgi:hypothetical protein
MTSSRPIRMKRAHDVRRLRQCPLCGHLGDSADMLEQPAAGDQKPKHVHGRCWLAEYGIASLLEQPADQLLRLRLGDLDTTTTRAVLDRLAPAA